MNWIDKKVILQDPYITSTYVDNDDNDYFVRYVSLDGSDTGCMKASIIYDIAPPNTPIVRLKSDSSNNVILPVDVTNVSPTILWDSVTDDENKPKSSGIMGYRVEIHEGVASGAATNPVISKYIDKTLLKTFLTGYSEVLSYLDNESEKYGRTMFSNGASFHARVYAIDNAGNESLKGLSDTWSLDQTPPEITSIQLVSNDLSPLPSSNICHPSKNAAGIGFATTGIIPTVRFVANDVPELSGASGSGMDHLSIDIWNVSGSAPVKITNTSPIKVLPANFSNADLNALALSQGISLSFSTGIKYSLTAVAYDKAGNASLPFSSSVSNYWIVDKVAPIFTPASLSQGIADTKNLTLDSSFVFPTVADNEGLFSTSDFYIEDTVNGVKFGKADNLIANRKYQVKASAKDCVANQAATISSNRWCVDTSAPQLSSAIGSISTSQINITSKTFSFTSPSGADSIPTGGSCAVGVDGIQFQLVRVDGSDNVLSSLASGDFTDLKAIESISGAKAISYTSLVTGNYKLKIIVVDKVGNKSEYLSSNSIGISNDPPKCTNTTLALASSPGASLVSGIGGSAPIVGASKVHYLP